MVTVDEVTAALDRVAAPVESIAATLVAILQR